MKGVKQIILSICLIGAFGGSIWAQEQVPRLYLETFEKCNNYARHYCLNGSHEAAVNRTLLEMKRKGQEITVRVIKKVARSTPSRLSNPAAQTSQE